MTVSRELAGYKLDLVGVQEVRWEGGGTEPAGEYTFVYGKGNENHELGVGFFVHKRIISAVKQIEVHTAEPLVPGPSRLEVEIAVATLKMHKSPGSDQITGELIQAGGEILLSAIHKLINSVWNKEELPDQWK
jgi:hypothetical protein